MIILDKLNATQYLIITIDFLIVFAFFYIALRNLQTLRIVGLFKALMFIIVFWFVSRVAGLEMSTKVFGVMISYAFLAVIVIFPEEFKRMLDNFGRKDIVTWNKYKLIDVEGIKELSAAIMELSRRREGALIVIARKSDLQEEIERGEDVGKIKIERNIIQELLRDGGYFSKGALIIRDNEIVSTNVMLDMENPPDLVRRGAGKRHLAGYWVTENRDAIAVMVSGKTGKVSISSTEKGELNYTYGIPTKETDITRGIDEIGIASLIENRLTGKNSRIEQEELRKKKGKRKKGKKDKEQKERERNEKKGKKKNRKKKENKKKRKEEKKEAVSKGFGDD